MQISGLLFGLAPPNTQFADSVVPVLLQHGVKSAVVFYSNLDPFTVCVTTVVPLVEDFKPERRRMLSILSAERVAWA